ncbi:saccharopine dehydrogenase family protein [uncultured Ilumatobacter sp.]|uniref:saccharopine dehydrogenase family protein n=1 Tax=uncultured Ilumatobacter sp. TaxID=879968 RepID=UPI00374F9594
MAAKRTKHDIVIFGATSFVGQILCKYMVDRHGVDDASINWAIAGRNAQKLDAVVESTGAEVPRIVADAGDADAIAALCASTKLVVSTVGPYALYGSKLVAAVAEAGIDYCDLTGEPQWMQRMIDRYQDRATETGARIVHACGFDSIPSDLGVWYTQQEAIEQLGESCVSISMGVKAMKGGASGGTVASMMNMMEEVSADPSLRQVLGNPYAIAPKGDRTGPDQPNVTLPQYDDGLESWLAPFVMAATNTRLVFRTHALLDHPWGNDFTYGEAMMMGEGLGGRAKAMSLSGAMGGLMGAAAVGPVRKMMGRFLPEPGEGPTSDAQEQGFFDIRFHGTTASGAEIMTKVTGDRDPGYGSTSKMLGESALALLDSDATGGFWTPATALGDDLISRLVEHAGLTFEVL